MADNTSAAKAVHRKLIDIPEDVFRTLSIKAAATGISLKRLIENLLAREADETARSEAYKAIVASPSVEQEKQ